MLLFLTTGPTLEPTEILLLHPAKLIVYSYLCFNTSEIFYFEMFSVIFPILSA